jgi:hypothetical protein
MTRKLLPTLLVLILTVTACSIPSGILSPDPLPATVTTAPPTQPSVPELTPEMLRNAAYTFTGFSDNPQTVTLVDGAYASGSDPAAVGYLSVHIGDLINIGDLNYDDLPDAVVVLGVNTGGTGVFTYLAAVLNVNGAPVHAASIFIDDRPIINSISIDSGEILAQTVLHSASDPMCCPSLPVEQGFRIYNENELVITRWAGQTGDGQPRAINITDPAELATVNYPFTVTGSVTIGPFENTLAYNIYAPDNTLVTSGSVMTDSPNPGDPGSFSLPVDLSLAGVTGFMRIEFVEYSMMDGSVMTLDSVLVNVP